jgi:bifunctional non-homologous end joining protein LigD
MPTDAVAAPLIVSQSGLPRVEPVPLTPLAEPFDDPAWVFEPKYDGFRAILYGWNHACEFEMPQSITCPLQDLPKRVAEVLGGRETVLDGEIVSLDRQGKPVLQNLLQGGGYLTFAAYDILWLSGTDLRDQPLEARKELLAELLPEDTGPLYKVLTIEEHGRALFGAIKRLDLAGVIAKCRHDPYRPTTVWHEIRNPGCSRATEVRGELFWQPALHRKPTREWEPCH